ncbi:MAG: ATP-grasp domain-containing protein [Bacteroidia bacterium]
MRKQITVAVTGLNAIDSPGPGFAVIRGLKESKRYQVRIIGLAYENLEPLIYMRQYVDKVYQVPYPSSGHETLMSRLQYIQEQEQIDIIIPNFDAEILSFIKLSPKLADLGIKMLLPTEEQFEARLKGNLNEFGEKYGISIPKGDVVYSVAEMNRVLQSYKYPVVIKGKFYDAKIVYNQEQAQSAFYKISAQWGTPIIIQQFIKGQEYNVTALGNGKGKLIGAVQMRKTYITDKGKGWAGISIDDEDLHKMAKNVVENTQWGGGLELECIKDDEDGKVYLIEINPRFPAWVYLAVGCGQNHIEALVRIILGEKVRAFPQHKVGVMFVRYSYDMICNLEDFNRFNTNGEL